MSWKQRTSNVIGVATDAAPESWYNFEQLMNQRFSRMVNAEEEQDWWKYFVNFKFICFRLLPHMHPLIREGIDKDWRIMETAVRETELNEKNETSKKTKINHIRKNFVDTHQTLLFDTLPNAGLANIKADGDVNFEVMAFSSWKAIIRNTTGTPTAIKGKLQQEGGEVANE